MQEHAKYVRSNLFAAHFSTVCVRAPNYLLVYKCVYMPMEPFPFAGQGAGDEQTHSLCPDKLQNYAPGMRKSDTKNTQCVLPERSGWLQIAENTQSLFASEIGNRLRIDSMHSGTAHLSQLMRDDFGFLYP